jgi:hypothetical protein
MGDEVWKDVVVWRAWGKRSQISGYNDCLLRSEIWASRIRRTCEDNPITILAANLCMALFPSEPRLNANLSHIGFSVTRVTEAIPPAIFPSLSPVSGF